MKKYSIHDGSRHVGDFTLEELRQAPPNPNHFVWFEGLEGWKPLSEIEELAALLPGKPVPPPFPPAGFNQAAPPVFPQNAASPGYYGGPSPYYQNVNLRFGYELANWWQRLLGNLIMLAPTVFFFIIYIALYLFTEDTDLEDPFSNPVAEVVGLAIVGTGILMGAVFYPLWGGNLGHKVLGLKVISSKDGTDIRHGGTGAVREVCKLLLEPFWIPCIMLLWDKNRQNLYDKMTEGYVVKNRPPR